MRQLLTYTVCALGFSIVSPALAKTNVSVGRFEDKAEVRHCALTTAKFKANLDQDLQEKLIGGLLQLQRFEIQEREIRRIKPEHTLVGSLRTFEVCAVDGRHVEAKIEIDVQMVNAQKGLTHLFTTSANATSTAPERAVQMAVTAAIGQVIKRVDDAVPRRQSEQLPFMRARSPSGDNGMTIQLVRRDRR